MKTAILGSGGHAHVLRDILGSDSYFVQYDEVPNPEDFVVIGLGDIVKRIILFDKHSENVVSVRHLSAIVEPSARVPVGTQLLAKSFIGSRAKLGVNVLINTGAQVDHDCIIGNHCHIAPGVILCGGVTVGEGTFIGAGAIVPEGSVIPANSFVKAGTVWRNTSPS